MLCLHRLHLDHMSFYSQSGCVQPGLYIWAIFQSNFRGRSRISIGDCRWSFGLCRVKYWAPNYYYLRLMRLVQYMTPYMTTYQYKMAVCVAVIGKEVNTSSFSRLETILSLFHRYFFVHWIFQNYPLYLRTVSPEEELKFHYTVHTSLDVVEEKGGWF